MSPDDADLAAKVTAAIRFMQNLNRSDPVALGRVAVQMANNHGWENTNGAVASERALYKQLLIEAQTEIMYLRAQLQEIECPSPS